MNDYLIHYVVFTHDKALKPLETLKMTIRAYCKANAKEQFPYWNGLIKKIQLL